MAITGILGLIVPWPGGFAPQYWRYCDGSLLPIAQYEALFTLLGTQYGGDGRSNFAIPDLRGRVAFGSNQMGGAGAPPAVSAPLGATGGQCARLLSVANIPPHVHGMDVSATASIPVAAVAGTVTTPTAASSLAGSGTAARKYYAPAGTTPSVTLGGAELRAKVAIKPGGGVTAPLPVPTVPPCMGLDFIICVEGLFPSQS